MIYINIIFFLVDQNTEISVLCQESRWIVLARWASTVQLVTESPRTPARPCPFSSSHTQTQVAIVGCSRFPVASSTHLPNSLRPAPRRKGWPPPRRWRTGSACGCRGRPTRWSRRCSPTSTSSPWPTPTGRPASTSIAPCQNPKPLPPSPHDLVLVHSSHQFAIMLRRFIRDPAGEGDDPRWNWPNLEFGVLATGTLEAS